MSQPDASRSSEPAQASTVEQAKKELAEAQSAWGHAIRNERYRDEALPLARVVDQKRDALIAAARSEGASPVRHSRGCGTFWCCQSNKHGDPCGWEQGHDLHDPGGAHEFLPGPCDCGAEGASQPAQAQELIEALRRVRAHTSYGNTSTELLTGLLQSIERIADAALALAQETP